MGNHYIYSLTSTPWRLLSSNAPCSLLPAPRSPVPDPRPLTPIPWPPSPDPHSLHPIFLNIMSFLNQHELFQSVLLIRTSWTDAASETLCNLRLESVGCSISKTVKNDNKLNNLDKTDMLNGLSISSSVANLIEKDWTYRFDLFPTREFISNGGFKRVYWVWNKVHKLFETISVMWDSL